MVDRQSQGNQAPGLTADQAARKRLANAKYHNAAQKARRRQWDKPKKPPREKLKPVTEQSPPPPPFSLSPNSPTGTLTPKEARLLTSAEHFAVNVLLGMAADGPDDDLVFSAPFARYSQCPDDPTLRVEGYIMTLEVTPSLYSGSTPSPSSSVMEVDDEPIRLPKLDEDTWLERGGFYRYMFSPATRTQKHVQRELGLLGPLTPVQVAQFRMLEITYELSDGTEEELEVPAPVGPFLSSVRWENIRSWRSQIEEDEGDWDVELRFRIASAESGAVSGHEKTKEQYSIAATTKTVNVVHLAIVRQGGDAPDHLAAGLIRDTQDLGVGFVAGVGESETSEMWQIKYKRIHSRGGVQARLAPNAHHIPGLTITAARGELGLQLGRRRSDSLQKGGGGLALHVRAK
ncbi:hypothetical protein B0H14DRAFT_2654295 [Mycena olivaceomarginata]|nr:hypothetical protein B0H14DRAFT_2654295 [Mycena olivaceomarginata]